ncbi:MAG: YncE family protein [Candidatus Micrarchaeales archaeon]|nr:YncE family protein [Candidatus Micrarchaeales archaeon]
MAPFGKGQSAIEYLTTYGWTILVVIIVIALLFVITKPSAGSNCIPESGYSCTSPALNASGYLEVTFSENLNLGNITVTGLQCTTGPVTPSTFQAADYVLEPNTYSNLIVHCPISSGAIGNSFSGYLWIQYHSNEFPNEPTLVDNFAHVILPVTTNNGFTSLTTVATTTTVSTTTLSSSTTTSSSTITTTTAEYLYISAQGANKLLEVSTVTNSVVTYLTMSGPTGVVVSPNGESLYVGDCNNNDVYQVSTSTFTVTNTIPVGACPYDLAITPDGSTVYVTNSGGSTVSKISTGTATVVNTIPAGSGPLGIALSPDGNYAYVADYNVGDFAAIQLSTDTTTLHSIPGSGYNFYPIVSANNTNVYVPDGYPDNVIDFSTVTNTIVGNVTGFINSPYLLLLSPNGSTLYIDVPDNATIYKAHTSDNLVYNSIHFLNGGEGRQAALSSSGDTLYYIDNSGNLSIVNVATGQVTNTIPVVGGLQCSCFIGLPPGI